MHELRSERTRRRRAPASGTSTRTRRVAGALLLAALLGGGGSAVSAEPGNAAGGTAGSAPGNAAGNANGARRGKAASEGVSLADLTVRATSEVSAYTDDTDVHVLTPTVGATIESPTGGWSVGGRYLVDVVTAASPDIIAAASPPWTEVRHAGSIDGSYQSGDYRVGGQGSVSVEPDYRSLSAGVQGSIDFDEKNYTLLLAYAFRHDIAGRVGTPFDVFGRVMVQHALSSGLTVVINPSAVMAFNIDAMLEQGNQAKPYRYVPIFDPAVAGSVRVGASVAEVSAMRLHARPIEALPLHRERFALTGRLAYRFSGATLRVEERLYADTWGTKASTTDLRYMFDIGRRVTLWPHVRMHVQTGADFWERAYGAVRGGSGALLIPGLRTGDRELGPLQSLTGGGGMSLALGSHWSASLQVDGVFTNYTDAMYISYRRALFAALGVQAVFD
ncbi:DUF3570 domain-containing protein [Chondromyces crocatus]|uniref:DUF3570 domain-containing protein n=1 Tax=Chondromyces crocatus TaxID=52 RepID=UPI00067A81D2|nr:DUF3570 domain-containing protein [Chondromyces crocatus]